MRRWPGKESPGLTQLVVRRNGLVGTRGAGDDQRDRDRHTQYDDSTERNSDKFGVSSLCCILQLRGVFSTTKKKENSWGRN